MVVVIVGVVRASGSGDRCAGGRAMVKAAAVVVVVVVVVVLVVPVLVVPRLTVRELSACLRIWDSRWVEGGYTSTCIKRLNKL